MLLNNLQEKGLLTLYYRGGADFRIYRVADWSIMAISMNPDHTYDDEGDVTSSTYYAWHIDQEFAEKIMANNAMFNASLVSKSTRREPDLSFSTEDASEQLAAIREEVKNGTRKCLIDRDFENMLKGNYLKNVEDYVMKYGNPPVFTKKKFWTVVLAFLLYPLGMPWFMAGDRKGGLIQAGVFLLGSVLSVVFMPILIPVTAFAVINMGVFYVRLFGEKIRDNEGKIVISKSRQSYIAAEIEKYNQYKKDIAGGTENE